MRCKHSHSQFSIPSSHSIILLIKSKKRQENWRENNRASSSDGRDGMHKHITTIPWWWTKGDSLLTICVFNIFFLFFFVSFIVLCHFKCIKMDACIFQLMCIVHRQTMCRVPNVLSSLVSVESLKRKKSEKNVHDFFHLSIRNSHNESRSHCARCSLV